MKTILICPKCRRYTLKETCQACKRKTKSPAPPRFSPEDKYGKYRRIAKKNRSSSHKVVANERN